MAIPFLHNINLSSNEIQNVKLHNTSSVPQAAAVGNQGQVYFNTTASTGLSGAGKKVYISTDVDTADTYAYQALAFESWVTANFNNYTHPNHTGHVTSTGDGATVLTVSAITDQTELTSGLSVADEFVISDGGVIKRMDVAVLQTYMQSNLTFTTDTNTTYDLSVQAGTANTSVIRLAGSDATNDDVTISGTSTTVKVTESGNTITLDLQDDVTIANDLTVTGDLTVSGTTTTVNTETINLADNIITLNSNATGSATEDAGIEVERGDDANVSLFWDESEDAWTITNTSGTHQILQAVGAPGGKIKIPLTVDASPTADNVTSVTKSSNKYTINHSLATQDLIIQIVDISAATPTYETVFADIERPSTGTITVDFANAVTDGDYKLLATQI